MNSTIRWKNYNIDKSLAVFDAIRALCVYRRLADEPLKVTLKEIKDKVDYREGDTVFDYLAWRKDLKDVFGPLSEQGFIREISYIPPHNQDINEYQVLFLNRAHDLCKTLQTTEAIHEQVTKELWLSIIGSTNGTTRRSEGRQFPWAGRPTFAK